MVEEAKRRRTFAIISHPDAGKTTLTEKLLLYGGRGRRGRVGDRAQGASGRRRRTGWSSSAGAGSRSPRRCCASSTTDVVFNLLDTPGHKDFSEDTLRVLAAVDAP